MLKPPVSVGTAAADMGQLRLPHVALCLRVVRSPLSRPRTPRDDLPAAAASLALASSLSATSCACTFSQRCSPLDSRGR